MVIVGISICIGFIIGLNIPFTISDAHTQYVAIAILACFDTIFGGIYAELMKKFDLKVFLSGFFLNSTLACLIIFIGDSLGVDLSVATVVVFATRLFNNFSKIRQKLLQKK